MGMLDAVALTMLFTVACAAPSVAPSLPAPGPAQRGAGLRALSPQRFAEPALPELVFADPERRAKIAATFPELDAFFAKQLANEKLPGLAVGVVVDGELAWSKGYGFADLEAQVPMDADSALRMGSMTKVLTATAVMQLRDEGKLQLGDPAEWYVPELAGVVYPRRDAARMTVSSLLTHSSGLPEWGPYSFTDPGHEVNGAEIRRTLPGTALVLSTGNERNYSNVGMITAGFVVENISGLPYRTYVTERLFRPLGMTASAWNEEDVPRSHFAKGYVDQGGVRTSPKNWRIGATSPAGGSYSSVRDLSRFIGLQLAAWANRDGPDSSVVRRASLREMHMPQFTRAVRAGPFDDPDSPWLVDFGAYSQGLGWEVFSTCDFERVVYKAGGEEDGYSAYMTFLPGEQVGLVVMWNGSGSDGTYDTFRPALRILGHHGGLQKSTARPAAGLAIAKGKLDRLLAHWDAAEADRFFAPLVIDAISDTPSRADWEKVMAKLGSCRARDDLEVGNGLTNGHWTADCDHGRIALAVDVAQWSPLVVRDYRFEEQHDEAHAPKPPERCPRKPTSKPAGGR
jgi:CubicO group peptidase (beta-lactamase class C family)